MAKVKFNSVYFDNNISPSVKKAKDDLIKAKSEARYLSMTSGYAYYSYLINLDDKIESCIDDLDRFDSWVYTCKREYKNISDKYKDELERLDNYSIKKHPKL